jgi:feruloyl esterase
MRLFLLAAISAGVVSAATTCDNLASLKLPTVTVSQAAIVAAANNNPAYCRLAGSIRPTSDSDIRFEVWMPEAGWNGNFQGVGNGGFAGSLSLAALPEPLRRGFAVATTDTGHTTGDASWALGHPEKLVDYAHRAVHEMTVTAKAIVTAFYGRPPAHSYFSSCSNGGRQALMEAQRYPADYDGIISGAPANDFTRIAVGFLYNQLALRTDPAALIPPAKWPAVQAAALAACDAADGLKDNLIDDPRRCRFDPASLLCSGAENDSCLTAPQIAALRKIYEGPKTPTGKSIFPGFVPGAEAGPGGWGAWISGPTADRTLQYFFATQLFRNMVFEDPAWDYTKFDFDKDVQRTQTKLAPILNATNADIRPFLKRGGKLILYHGWCDAALTPLNTINYFNAVTAKVGKKAAANSIRLYMLPGVQHCAAGPGPDQIWGGRGTPADASHDLLKTLEAWVEKQTPPAAIIASKVEAGKVTRARPLCPFPQTARYNGSGNPDDPASFACR